MTNLSLNFLPDGEAHNHAGETHTLNFADQNSNIKLFLKNVKLASYASNVRQGVVLSQFHFCINNSASPVTVRRVAEERRNFNTYSQVASISLNKPAADEIIANKKFAITRYGQLSNMIPS